MLVQESSARLRAIEAVLPSALQHAVQAGPLDSESWCLVVSSTAAAAKLRQLIPLIQTQLTQQGWQLRTIRLKVRIVRA